LIYLIGLFVIHYFLKSILVYLNSVVYFVVTHSVINYLEWLVVIGFYIGIMGLNLIDG